VCKKRKHSYGGVNKFSKNVETNSTLGHQKSEVKEVAYREPGNMTCRSKTFTHNDQLHSGIIATSGNEHSGSYSVGNFLNR
jgi:hypothetical protein